MNFHLFNIFGATMKPTLLSLTLFLLIGLPGCATSPQKWYKAGATSHHFERDQSDCEDAVLSSGTTTATNAQTYSFEGCMEGKGWIVLDPS